VILDSSPDFDVVVEVETETETEGQSFEVKPMHSRGPSKSWTDEGISVADFEDLMLPPG